MVAQALLEHPNDVAAFQRCLASKFRWWFLGLPAGVGLATARACLKLWLGFYPERSGVYSARNGPAMRSAIIGAFSVQKSQNTPVGQVPYFWPAQLIRNLLFLAIVLVHGFRRLLPI